ncbi:hypothetical protein LCGC14_0894380 [marine sediment metagenome]|uniref:NTP pyrophosphohydrolase MazG putative catalytic core domain-containing protein n=1 Tax=marine sediment metagenome TaxID=412755 RepID=A0A0F9S593_9ZZZZ
MMVQEYLDVRPAVIAFAKVMEETLRLHDSKGGWDGNIDEFLKAKMCEETAEMFMRHVEGEMGEAANEAVDVANICMMLWTRWTERGEEYLK